MSTSPPTTLRGRISSELVRIVRTYVLLATALVAGIAVLAAVAYQRTEINHGRELVLTKVGTEVSNVGHELESLATSSLLWTGLTDSVGRETYMAPLLAQFNRSAQRQFVVLDYRGRVFLAGGMEEAQALAVSAPVVEAVKAGRNGAGLLVNARGAVDVVLVQRVMSPQSETPVGFIVATIDSGRLVARLDLDSQARVAFALDNDAFVPANDDFWLVGSESSDQVSAGDFNIALRVRVTEPVSDALLLIFMATLAACLMGVWTLRRVVTWSERFSAATTRRLDRLLEDCQKLLAGEPVRALDETEHDELSEVTQALGVMLRKQRRAADEMRTTSLVFSTAAEGILVTDPQGHIVDANPALCAMTGYARHELLGRRSGSLYRSVGRGDKSREMVDSLAATGRWTGETDFLNRQGQLIPSSVAISSIRDEVGHRLGHVAVITDVSRLKAAENKLRDLAYHDALTGLANLRLLTRQARDMVSSLPVIGGRLAVLFVDVDQLKFVNDNYGHEAGDAMIKAVAVRLQEILPPGHLLCRRSGDEYIALVDLSAQGSTAALRQALERLNPVMVTVGKDQIPATATVGVSRLPEDGRSWQELQICADVAMNEAKHVRRGSVLWYDAHLGAKLFRQRLIQTKLAQAIERRALQVHYQPEVDLRTGEVVGFEALARWTDSELGVVEPSEFIPICEDAHLADQLTMLVASLVLRDKPALQARFPGAKVAFNAAPQVFRNADLLQYLSDQATANPLALEGLEVELTETHMAREEALLLPQLQMLTALGVRLVIDDFGTGYSSLSRLTQLPISRLKIDRSFVAGLHTDRQDRIARLIVNMAQGLGLDVTAEGLEEPAQREALLAMGCHRGQGWLFAPALPLDEVLLLMVPLEPTVQVV